MTLDLLPAVMGQREACEQFTSAQWEVLLGQARRSSLVSRLASHYEGAGWIESVPAQPRRHLEAAKQIASRQRQEVLWEVNRLEYALRGVDTPLVLLKGAAYVLADLPPARSRIFSDIDIMVRKERLEEVEGALFASGWIAQERDAYNDRYYRKWMHEIPPLIHAARGSALDVHHTITPPTSRHRVDARKILAKIRPIDDSGRLFVLAPVDMVLHSAVHLFQEGEFEHGLRDLLDMADLLTHFSREPAFRGQLFERAQELSLQRPLYYALSQLKRIFPSLIADWRSLPFESLRPGRFVETGMSLLLALALRPNHPTCDDAATRAARWILYIRAHLLRMPAYLLIPHLLRKAYVRRFPTKRPAEGEAGT